MHVGAFHALVLVHAGEASARAGRRAQALAHARRALTLARERGEQGTAAYALHLLGELAALGDSPEPEAADYYRQALELAQQLGMRPLAAHCHLGLGKLYQRTDKREQADDHLATAGTMYREMGMTC